MQIEQQKPLECHLKLKKQQKVANKIKLKNQDSQSDKFIFEKQEKNFKILTEGEEIQLRQRIAKNCYLLCFRRYIKILKEGKKRRGNPGEYELEFYSVLEFYDCINLQKTQDFLFENIQENKNIFISQIALRKTLNLMEKEMQHFIISGLIMWVELGYYDKYIDSISKIKSSNIRKNNQYRSPESEKILNFLKNYFDGEDGNNNEKSEQQSISQKKEKNTVKKFKKTYQQLNQKRQNDSEYFKTEQEDLKMDLEPQNCKIQKIQVEIKDSFINNNDQIHNQIILNTNNIDQIIKTENKEQDIKIISSMQLDQDKIQNDIQNLIQQYFLNINKQQNQEIQKSSQRPFLTKQDISLKSKNLDFPQISIKGIQINQSSYENQSQQCQNHTTSQSECYLESPKQKYKNDSFKEEEFKNLQLQNDKRDRGQILSIFNNRAGCENNEEYQINSKEVENKIQLSIDLQKDEYESDFLIKFDQNNNNDQNTQNFNENNLYLNDIVLDKQKSIDLNEKYIFQQDNSNKYQSSDNLLSINEQQSQSNRKNLIYEDENLNKQEQQQQIQQDDSFSLSLNNFKQSICLTNYNTCPNKNKLDKNDQIFIDNNNSLQFQISILPPPQQIQLQQDLFQNQNIDILQNQNEGVLFQQQQREEDVENSNFNYNTNMTSNMNIDSQQINYIPTHFSLECKQNDSSNSQNKNH